MVLLPRWKVPLRVRVAWNLGLAGYTALVALLLVLDQRVKAHSWRWVHNPKILIPAVSLLILATFLDTARRGVLRLRHERPDKAKLEIHKALVIALVAAGEHLQTPVSNLGCGFFMIRPRGWRRPEHMERVVRARILSNVPETGTKFVRGKGAVGRCWRDGRTSHTDWRAMNKLYGRPQQRAALKAAWPTLTDDQTCGFSEAEFTALVGRYAEVVAVPVMQDGELIGCVALDRRWNDDRKNQILLADQAIEEVLETAAEFTAAELKKR